MKLKELLQHHDTNTHPIRVFNQDLTSVKIESNLNAEVLKTETNDSEHYLDVFILSPSFNEDELAEYISSTYDIPFQKALETKIFNQGTMKAIDIQYEYKDYSLIIFVNLAKQTISYRMYDNGSYLEFNIFNYKTMSQTAQNYREGGYNKSYRLFNLPFW